MTSSRLLQLTVAILKPDVTAQPHISHKIKQLMLSSGFYFVRSKRLHLTRSRAEGFYKEHEGRFFHNRLVTFMSSGPISVSILSHENAIAHWRKLMGPTKVLRTIHEEPDSIRGQFGLTDTRNSTHGSDSEKSAKREISFFFPEFNVENWYEEDELLFRNGQVEFDPVHRVHICDHHIQPVEKKHPALDDENLRMNEKDPFVHE